MRFRAHLHTGKVPSTEKPQPTDTETNNAQIAEKDGPSTDVASQSDVSDAESEEIPEFQLGVKRAEAVLQVWTKRDLIVAYFL
jgi:hypothetical protein